jgi:hypothetical protein
MLPLHFLKKPEAKRGGPERAAKRETVIRAFAALENGVVARKKGLWHGNILSSMLPGKMQHTKSVSPNSLIGVGKVLPDYSKP